MRVRALRWLSTVRAGRRRRQRLKKHTREVSRVGWLHRWQRDPHAAAGHGASARHGRSALRRRRTARGVGGGCLVGRGGGGGRLHHAVEAIGVRGDRRHDYREHRHNARVHGQHTLQIVKVDAAVLACEELLQPRPRPLVLARRAHLQHVYAAEPALLGTWSGSGSGLIITGSPRHLQDRRPSSVSHSATRFHRASAASSSLLRRQAQLRVASGFG